VELLENEVHVSHSVVGISTDESPEGSGIPDLRVTNHGLASFNHLFLDYSDQFGGIIENFFGQGFSSKLFGNIKEANIAGFWFLHEFKFR
jgi:hypothetical protein